MLAELHRPYCDGYRGRAGRDEGIGMVVYANWPSVGFFFQAEDGIRDRTVTGVQTCALPILKDANDECLHIAADAEVVSRSERHFLFKIGVAEGADEAASFGIPDADQSGWNGRAGRRSVCYLLRRLPRSRIERADSPRRALPGQSPRSAMFPPMKVELEAHRPARGTHRSIGTACHRNCDSSPPNRMLPARRTPPRRWRSSSRADTLRSRRSRRGAGSAAATIPSAPRRARNCIRSFGSRTRARSCPVSCRTRAGADQSSLHSWTSTGVRRCRP